MLQAVNRILINASRRPKLIAGLSTNAEMELLSKKVAPFSATPPDNVEKILKILNSEDLEQQQLIVYDITKIRAGKLLTWMKRNGPLEKLDDILQVEGFSLKTAEKFYRSLLKEPKAAAADKQNRSRSAPFITPNIEEEQRLNIRSIVAVRVGVSSVTWARLELASNVKGAENEPCMLTHWQHHEIAEKKLHISDLIQRCIYVNHEIPTADCYLLENPQMAQQSTNPGSVEQQNISIQKSQVTAVMAYALAARQTEEQTKSPKVFYLRRFLAARLFSHLVGTERVSSEETVKQLMRTYYNMDELEDETTLDDQDQTTSSKHSGSAPSRLSFRGNVQFPEDLRYMFAKANRYHREFLGQSLLLNLTFVRLVLLRDSDSIALLTRGSNPNKNVDSISDL